MAALYKINLIQGETFNLKFTYKDDQATPQPISLVGYTIVGSVKSTTSSLKSYPFTVTYNSPKSDGVFYLSLPYSTISNIPIVTINPLTPDIFVYDVFLITDATDIRKKLLYGEAWIYPSATKGI
jgi:hypothetical protein